MISRLAKLDLETDEAGAEGAVRLIHDEASLVLDLTGIVELDAERARLGRELDRLAGDIAKIDKKLGDPRFVEKAPAHVQEAQHEPPRRGRGGTAEDRRRRLDRIGRRRLERADSPCCPEAGDRVILNAFTVALIGNMARSSHMVVEELAKDASEVRVGAVSGS